MYLEWIENSYCPSFFKIQEYANLSEALNACSSNSNKCKSIVDYECDSQEFWTCSEDILPSALGSCAWTYNKGIKDIICLTCKISSTVARRLEIYLK